MQNLSPEAAASADSLTIVICGTAAVLLAAGSGFWCGIQYAQHREQRLLDRALQGFQQIYQTVLQRMEFAREACGHLERVQAQCFSTEQLERLTAAGNRLTEQFSRVLSRHAPPPEPTADVAAPMQIKWQVTPEDRATGLPDKSAFESNFEMLLELGRKLEQSSGLLLIRLDKFDGLRERHGAADARKLLKKLGSVICRAVRDVDLVCQYAPDMFAVLLPAAGSQGESLASAIRDAVRSYHYRLEETGPEILVTASLGYTPCGQDDNVDFAENRAEDAVARSQRMGRNQLHLHDGAALTHCMTG